MRFSFFFFHPNEIVDFFFVFLVNFLCQVIGVPDVRLGEEVAAWVQLKDGEKATEEELKDFCKEKVRLLLIFFSFSAGLPPLFYAVHFSFITTLSPSFLYQPT